MATLGMMYPAKGGLVWGQMRNYRWDKLLGL